MAYMSLARLRCIQAPKAFTQEFLMRKPCLVMLSIWIFSLGFWSFVVFGFGVPEYTNWVLYDPAYVKLILNFFFWFIPMMMIISFAGLTIYLLVIRRRKKMSKSKRISKLRNEGESVKTRSVANTTTSSVRTGFSSLASIKSLIRSVMSALCSPEIKFMIIILTYWLQWAPPCFATMLQPLCNCIPDSTYAAIYWVTYTVCMTDPLVILILNPNVSCMKKVNTI